MKTTDLKIHPDLSRIFRVQQEVLGCIMQDMAVNGYDQNCPIVVAKGAWVNGNNFILDGHTRHQAAICEDVDDVPVVFAETASLEDAIVYAIKLQKNRRNLTQEEIVACIEAMYNALAVSSGGDRRSESFKVSRDVLKSKTSQVLAQKLGVSSATVERVRAVLGSDDEEIKEKMRAGDMKVRPAYDIIQGRVPRSVRTQKRAEIVAQHGTLSIVEAVRLGNLTISAAADIALLPPETQDELMREFSPRDAVAQARMLREQHIQDSQDEENLFLEAEATRRRVFTRVRGKNNLADWVWNPITGCENGCHYCYAKWQAHIHYTEAIPDPSMRFKPRLRREMLTAPRNTHAPIAGREYLPNNKVIVCDMGDMFGKWVPTEWISDVIKAMQSSPQWIYLLLTKNPSRYLDFSFPSNCWLGATTDTQERMNSACEVFQNIKTNIRFVSVTPMLEQICLVTDSGIYDAIDWIIIGAQIKTNNVEPKQPKWEWVWRLTQEADNFGVPVYWQNSLSVKPEGYPQTGGA